MEQRSLLDWTLLVALVGMWGSAFLLTKVAVTTIPPATVVAVRLLIAAAILLALTYASGKRLPNRLSMWSFFAIVAILGNSLPFFLISWGQQYIDSGVAGILMAIMPLATLILAHFFVAGERMNGARLVGFLLGFVGIVVLMGPAAMLKLGGSGSYFVAELAVLTGALCYAVTTIVARHRPRSDVLAASAGITLVGSTIMVPVAVFVETPWAVRPSADSVLAVVALGVFSTAAATVGYLKLVSSAGPTFLSLTNYLIPPWALAMGAIFLNERLQWSALCALALILLGIAIAQRAALRFGSPPFATPGTQQDTSASRKPL